MSRRSLPLGLDLGATRVRVAEAVVEDRVVSLQRVVTFDRQPEAQPSELGRELRSILQEAGIRERRCILCVAEPDATLRTVTFPPMSTRERVRAARFEAARFVDAADDDDLCVRARVIDQSRHLYALGMVRNRCLQSRLSAAKAAGLRALCVDHEAYALRRAFPYADAVLDMGYAVSRLYAYGAPTPIGATLDGGSSTFTSAIARALDVDLTAAERRKRAMGFAGAGESELCAFTHSVGRALLGARTQGASEIQRIVLTGNGARLIGLATRLERDTGCTVDVAAHIAVNRSTYAEDILRSSAADWGLSAALATWSTTESAE